jgi:hypothetical protein
MVMSSLQKMLPMASYDEEEKRALDLAEAEWQRSHSTNDDLSPAHRAFVITRAREIVKTLPDIPATTGDVISGHYNANVIHGRSITKPYKPPTPISGPVEIDLGDFDPERPNAFKPYNNGTTRQGPSRRPSSTRPARSTATLRRLQATVRSRSARRAPANIPNARPAAVAEISPNLGLLSSRRRPFV